MHKTFDIVLVLILALIACYVAVGLYYHMDMWTYIVVYWGVLTIKNVNNFMDILHKKRYPKAKDPYYLQRKGTPEYVGPFWSYDKAYAYAKNDKEHEYRLVVDINEIDRAIEEGS